jgi:hypothetical protein
MMATPYLADMLVGGGHPIDGHSLHRGREVGVGRYPRYLSNFKLSIRLKKKTHLRAKEHLRFEYGTSEP